MLPPALIGLAVLVALIALLPARRLQLAGLAPRLITGYVVVIWLGGMVVGMAPGTSRWLFPILLIAWLGPFVVAPDRLNRVFRRGGPGSGLIKDVTPPAGRGGADRP